MRRRVMGTVGRGALVSGGWVALLLGALVALPMLVVEVNFHRQRRRREGRSA